MTTNKPKQVGWCAANGEILSISGKKRWLDLGEKLRTRAHCFDEPLIRLSDYEALQAEYEELRAALAESRANDLTAMGYLNQIRQLVGGDDFPDMVRRCEKLRKVADQYRRLIELGEDFQWENIIRVDISDFPSRADAIDAVMQSGPSI